MILMNFDFGNMFGGYLCSMYRIRTMWSRLGEIDN